MTNRTQRGKYYPIKQGSITGLIGMMTFRKYFLLAGIIAISVAGISPLSYAETVSARWQPYQIKFHFSSFDTYYSCDGIAGKMKSLLLAIGARNDVRIEDSCFGQSSQVQLDHRLLVAFALPVVADNNDNPEDIFPARWRDVQIRKNRPRYLDGGDCELVEHFIGQILPQLITRDIQNKIRCTSRSINLRLSVMTLTMLMPIEMTDVEQVSD
jgi:hypothetical protein